MNIPIDIFKNEPEVRTVQPGELVFRQGDDPQGCMFALLEGEVEIVRDDRCVARLGVGSLVGEMGLIDNEPRSASAKACTPVRVAVVYRKRFLFLVQQHPTFALAMMQMLTHRMRGKLES